MFFKGKTFYLEYSPSSILLGMDFQQLPEFPPHLKILETRFNELCTLYFTAMEMGMDIREECCLTEDIEIVRHVIGDQHTARPYSPAA